MLVEPTTILGVATLLGGLAFWFGVFRLLKPKPPAWTRKRAAYFTLGCVAFPLLVAMVVGPDRRPVRSSAVSAPPPTASAPAAALPSPPSDTEIAAYAKARNSKIDAAGIIDQEYGPLKGKLLRISFTRSGVDEEGFVVLGADELRSIAEKVTDKYKDHISGLQIVWNAPTRDPRTGNTDTSIAFVIGYPMVDLAKINWPNFDWVDFLNLAIVDAKSVGRKIATAYCEDPKAKQRSDTFCRNAGKG